LIARAAAVGALVLAVVVVAIVLIGGGSTHTYSMQFATAGQLVKDDDVQVGGRRIGSVRKIELSDDNQARIEVEVEEPYAPLHEGTQAVIRATSLSGVANRYIALTPGPDSNKELDDGALLRQDDTTTIVDLDQLFNTFDDPTRNHLRSVIRSLATQYRGKGKEAGQAAEYFNPVLSTSRRLFEQLTADEQTLTDFLVNSSRTVTTLASKRDDLAGSIANTNTTATAIADESTSLGQALDVLPATLRRANTTFVNLRSTLDDLDALVDASKPATKDLAPFLRELRPLVRDARPTIADLRKLLNTKGPDNDLVDATRKMPAFERAARPALANSTKALQKLQPVLEFARPYAPDLVGWFRDFGQGASTYDANGHYARIMPIANAFSFTDDGGAGVLDAIPPSARLDQLQKGLMERCPGAATQPAPDNSNPYVAPGFPAGACKPGEVPTGP
jgi:phospholipid/cholesterol/gamma-HCH transport system substrate-binding protein